MDDRLLALQAGQNRGFSSMREVMDNQAPDPIAQAILAERERCARIAEGEGVTHFPDTHLAERAYRACQRIAAAIRSGK